MSTLWTHNDWQNVPENSYENTWNWRNLYKTLSMWHLRQKISLPTCTQEWGLLTISESYLQLLTSFLAELWSKPLTEIIWILILVESLINVTSAILPCRWSLALEYGRVLHFDFWAISNLQKSLPIQNDQFYSRSVLFLILISKPPIPKCRIQLFQFHRTKLVPFEFYTKNNSL